MAGTVFREVLNDLQREGLSGDAQQIEGMLWSLLIRRCRVALMADAAVPDFSPGVALTVLTRHNVHVMRALQLHTWLS